MNNKNINKELDIINKELENYEKPLKKKLNKNYNNINVEIKELEENNKREEEEKRKLFQSKVKELEQLFQKESLNKLKDINFLETYGQEDETIIGLAIEGDGEGPIGDTESQDKDDSGDKESE